MIHPRPFLATQDGEITYIQVGDKRTELAEPLKVKAGHWYALGIDSNGKPLSKALVATTKDEADAECGIVTLHFRA